MTHRINRYGWYIQTVLLVLMLVAVGTAAGMVITAELARRDVSVILDASQAIDRGWPAKWGE